MRTWLVLISLICLPVHAAEYLYPVAWVQRADGIKIFLNYQKSVSGSHELLLWEWDPVTKVVSPVVLPAYTPAAVKLLPQTTERSGGLCFVDKGRIFVKSFNKRSPKSITFYEPIADIALIEWIDQNSFYFMGKEGKNFGIFQGTMQGGLKSVLYEPGCDFLYPQISGDHLYFIMRTEQGFKVGRVHMPEESTKDIFPNAEDYSDRVTELLSQQHKLVIRYPLVPSTSVESLVDLRNQTAAFLRMSSETRGHYVEHPTTIDRHQSHITCRFHEIACDAQGMWRDETLFEFRIATQLFVGASAERLYETLLPLLPRVDGDFIYYVQSSDIGSQSEIYKFDIHTKQSVQVSATSQNNFYFAPMRVNPMIFYGGALMTEDMGTGNSLPAIWINEEGMLCAELPAVVDVHSAPGSTLS